MDSVNDALWNQLNDAEKADLLSQYARRDPAAAAPLLVESLADLVARDFPPQLFLVADLIPAGQLVMLGGRGKAGKSWLVLQLIAAIDRGISFLGKPTKRGKVLYLALEDGRRRLNQRPRLMNWRPSANVDIAFRVDTFDHGGQGLTHIRQAIAAGGYDLVVIDTLVKTLSSAADENNNTEMGAICNELADMAHDSGACILIVHHTSKQAVENPFDALRGATAIRNAYDVGLMLVRKHGADEATIYVEARDFDAEGMTIRQAENGRGWEYLGDANVGVAIQAGRIGVDLIAAHGDGLTANDLADMSGKTVQAIRASMKTAEKYGHVTSKRERDGESNRWVDRYFLATSLSVPGEGLQHEK